MTRPAKPKRIGPNIKRDQKYKCNNWVSPVDKIIKDEGPVAKQLRKPETIKFA